MLTPADYELVRRDTGLTGLDHLLDTGKLLKLFQRTFSAKNYHAIALLYVRYKPQTSCLVKVVLESETGTEQAYATAYQQDNNDKFTKAASAPKELCAVLGNLGIILQRFPYDRKLGHMAELLDARQRPLLLEKTLGEAFSESRLEPLVYKPERRFVARLETQGQSYALKLYSKESFLQAQSNMQSLQKLHLSIAQGCGSSEKYRLIAFDWLEGQTLREHFSEGKASYDILYQLGQTLAELHQQDSSGFKTRERGFEKDRLERLDQWLSWLLPDLNYELYHLCSHLGQALFSTERPAALVHGDFYDKQVLIGHKHLGLIDFDEAYQGDPAHDIGLFSAHLERNVLIGRLSQEQYHQAMPAFLKGYQSVSPLPEGITLYTAAELIGLAPHFFRNRQENWSYFTRKLIFRASDLIKNSYLLSA